MLECDACGKKVAKRDAVIGYLAPGTVTCPGCYDYMENEVFAYKPEEDDGR